MFALEPRCLLALHRPWIQTVSVAQKTRDGGTMNPNMEQTSRRCWAVSTWTMGDVDTWMSGWMQPDSSRASGPRRSTFVAEETKKKAGCSALLVVSVSLRPSIKV